MSDFIQTIHSASFASSSSCPLWVNWTILIISISSCWITAASSYETGLIMCLSSVQTFSMTNCLFSSLQHLPDKNLHGCTKNHRRESILRQAVKGLKVGHGCFEHSVHWPTEPACERHWDLDIQSITLRSRHRPHWKFVWVEQIKVTREEEV